jgi:hypothetical protein
MSSHKISTSFFKIYLFFLIYSILLLAVFLLYLTEDKSVIASLIFVVVFEAAVLIQALGAWKYSASSFSSSGVCGFLLPGFTAVTTNWSELIYRPTTSLISPFYVFRVKKQQSFFLLPKPIATKCPELYRVALVNCLPADLREKLQLGAS